MKDVSTYDIQLFTQSFDCQVCSDCDRTYDAVVRCETFKNWLAKKQEVFEEDNTLIEEPEIYDENDEFTDDMFDEGNKFDEYSSNDDNYAYRFDEDLNDEPFGEFEYGELKVARYNCLAETLKQLNGPHDELALEIINYILDGRL